MREDNAARGETGKEVGEKQITLTTSSGQVPQPRKEKFGEL